MNQFEFSYLFSQMPLIRSLTLYWKLILFLTDNNDLITFLAITMVNWMFLNTTNRIMKFALKHSVRIGIRRNLILNLRKKLF